MIRLGIVNHHGRKPAGAEQALLLFLERLPSDVEPIFFLFEEGQFTDMLRTRYGNATVVPMSRRIATATRTALKANAVWDALALSKNLAGELKKERIDVVLTNSMKAHVVGSLAAKATNIPCINYMHDMLAGNARRIIRETSRFCGDERLACSRAVDQNLRLPHTTTVHSPIRISDYDTLPPRASARTALGLPDDGLPIVGLVGRILRWKGQDRFIRIAANVLRDTDARFAIIGGPIFGCEPEYPQELQDLVARERLESRVHFIPWQENLHNVYAAIDIACNCSTKEPFGRTTIEALACGVPAVCFDDAGVCEVFEQHRGGVHIPAGDENMFADAVRAYLLNSDLISKARKDAREAAQRFDIGHTSQLFNDVVRRVDALKKGGKAHA